MCLHLVARLADVAMWSASRNESWWVGSSWQVVWSSGATPALQLVQTTMTCSTWWCTLVVELKNIFDMFVNEEW